MTVELHEDGSVTVLKSVRVDGATRAVGFIANRYLPGDADYERFLALAQRMREGLASRDGID